MAFVFEQPRKLHQIDTNSSELGPGKYRLGNCLEGKNEYYAPFLSTCGRAQKRNKFLTPGPGAYSVNVSSKGSSEWGDDSQILKYSRIKKPQHGFSSTMTRFKVKDRIIPGPGSYQQFKGRSSKSPFSLKSHRSMNILQANLSKTKSLRVPTIPVKQNKNGYTVNEKNELIIIEKGKQKIIPADHTITEEYNPKMHASINYDNIAQKLIMCAKDMILKEFAKQKVKTQNQSVFVSPQKPLKRRLRQNIQQQPKYQKFILPGPGAYEPKIPSTKLKTLEKFQFFGSSSMRFQEEDKENEIINPIKSIFQKTTDYDNKKYKQTFAKCSRGLVNPDKEINPGPGKYLSSKFKYNQRKVVTSMQPRFYSSKTFSQSTQATYQQPQKPIIKPKIRPEIIKHYNAPPKKVESTKDLGPTTYDISVTDIAYEVMKRRSNAPFGCKNKRFMSIKQDNFDVQYLSSEPAQRQKNMNPFNASTRRFDYKNIESVGPGAYDQKDVLVKDSFNVKFVKVE